MTSASMDFDPTSMAGDIDCEIAMQRVFEYVDSEMTVAELERVRAHLEGCVDCDHEFGVEVYVKQLVHRACCESAPDQLRMRIVQQLTVLRSQDQSEAS